MTNFAASQSGQRGVVLLEVLVSIIILAIGLLGLAKLQASTRQLEMESYQRAQAMILLQDMVSRLTANIKTGACYITDDGAWVGVDGTPPADCAAGESASQQATAITDMNEWHASLNGAAEIEGGVEVGAMIGARGCISSYEDADPTTEAFLVTVTWQGLVKSAAPPDGLPCAIGEYGDEEQRRAVSAVVVQPNLDSLI